MTEIIYNKRNVFCHIFTLYIEMKSKDDRYVVYLIIQAREQYIDHKTLEEHNI